MDLGNIPLVNCNIPKGSSPKDLHKEELMRIGRELLEDLDCVRYVYITRCGISEDMLTASYNEDDDNARNSSSEIMHQLLFSLATGISYALGEEYGELYSTLESQSVTSNSRCIPGTLQDAAENQAFVEPSLLSILHTPQNPESGLQLQDYKKDKKEWSYTAHIPGSLILIAGMQLENLTQGRLEATKYRFRPREGWSTTISRKTRIYNLTV